MEELDQYLKKLKDSIQHLLKEYDYLKKENKLLKNKIADQNSFIAVHVEKINHLEQKIDTGKMDLQSLDIEDKTKLKERIDFYLSDIEKCLALLNA